MSQAPHNKIFHIVSRALLFGAFFTLVLMTSAASARADTITFSALEQAGNSLVHVTDPYVESGFRIVNVGELYYAQQSNSDYAAQPACTKGLRTD